MPDALVPRFTLIAGCVLVAAANSAQADAVTDWNQTAETASVAAGAPPQRNRVTAMTQIAVHDALNAIHARYKSYADIPAAALGASPNAAVAAASFRVLSQAVPGQAAALMLSYENRLDALPDCMPTFRSRRRESPAASAGSCSITISSPASKGTGLDMLPSA